MALTMQEEKKIMEEQIVQLKAQLAAQAKKSDKFEVEIGEYKGAPTLAFSGSFKPWRKGAGTIATLFRHKDRVLAALKECGVSIDAAA